MRSKIALLPFALLGLADVARAQPLIQMATEGPPEATMRARTEAGREAAMPLVAERLDVEIDRQFARTEILQTYHNRTAAVVEGQYRLRAGAASRVEGFAYWNGEDKIVGEVFEKETARRVYDEVTGRRRDPGLLEKVGDGEFAFRVFPIQPDEKKRVSITYTAWLARRGRRVEYRAPVHLAGAEIAVRIRSSRPLRDIRSSSHAIEIDRGGDREVVVVRAGAPRGKGGQLLLSWTIDEPAWSLAAAFHKDTGSDGYFVLALAAPPVGAQKVAAKDVTIVLDRSGSMAGLPIAQARQAAIDVVQRLGARDRLNVVAFDDEVEPLFEAPREASAATRARAITYISRLTEGGGTDIALALRTALAAQKDGKRPRVVLFLTDGQSSAPEAVQAIEQDRRDTRVFTVGVGTGVNRPLLSRLAAVKRGRFVHIRDPGDLERDVGMLYRSISRPLLVDVSLAVDGASAHGIYPRSLPDLFVDDEILISGRLTGTGPTRFALRGTLDGRPITVRARLEVRNGVRRPWVGRLWAESRVDHLSEKIALGEGTDEHRKEVVDLALAYNFVTDYTSFLAIPESELTGTAKDTLEGARARKRAILASHRDARSLDAPPHPAAPAVDDEGGGDEEDRHRRHQPRPLGVAERGREHSSGWRVVVGGDERHGVVVE
ncbi:MAG TPA: VIT and VWA domain-containing protein, partial [Kofleriaceae bacterium]|nr:VIT and VWA domain-containing protein [Kofleriaceae bacterium]